MFLEKDLKFWKKDLKFLEKDLKFSEKDLKFLEKGFKRKIILSKELFALKTVIILRYS